MDAAGKIRALREEYDLTQVQLAKIAGVSDKAVSTWESGARSPKVGPLQKICAHFGLDIHDFIDDTVELRFQTSLPRGAIPMPRTSQVPLIGDIACGVPILAEENIEEMVDLPEHIKADFALRCRGDSMINAGIRDGDVVYIRSQKQVNNGQIAAVRVGDDEATLKRFYYEDGVVQLVSENSTMVPKAYTGEAINQLEVIGLAVGYTHALEE